MNEIEIVTAEQAEALEAKVLHWVAQGWDVYGPVLTHESGIGQLIVRPGGEAEYRLVIASTFADLKRDVRSLIGDGYDLHYGESVWNGKMMQWMVRYRITSTGDILQGAERVAVSSNFQRVERIEAQWKLIPSILAGGAPLLVERGHVVERPSETSLSTS